MDPAWVALSCTFTITYMWQHTCIGNCLLFVNEYSNVNDIQLLIVVMLNILMDSRRSFLYGTILPISCVQLLRPKYNRTIAIILHIRVSNQPMRVFKTGYNRIIYFYKHQLDFQLDSTLHKKKTITDRVFASFDQPFRRLIQGGDRRTCRRTALLRHRISNDIQLQWPIERSW